MTAKRDTTNAGLFDRLDSLQQNKSADVVGASPIETWFSGFLVSKT